MSKIDVKNLSLAERETMIKKVKRIKFSMYASGLLAYALFNWVRSAGGMILPGMLEDYAWTPGQSALFVSVFTYIYAIANLPSGMLVDLFGSKLVMSISYTLITIGSLLFAYSDNFTMILIGRAITAIGGSAVYAGLSKCISAWETKETYPGINGHVQAFSKVGSLLAATPLAWMLAGLGRRNTMLIIACVGALITISLFVFTKNKPSDVNVVTISELKGKGAPEDFKTENQFKGMMKLLVQPQVWLLTLATIGINSTVNTIITNWGPTIMKTGLGIDVTNASYVITVCNLCMIIGAFCLAFTSKKMGVKKALSISYIFFGFVLLSMALFLPKMTLPILFVMYILLGLGTSYGIAALFAIGRNMVTTKFYGTCIGLINFVCWLFGSAVATNMWALFIDEAYSAASFQKAVWFQVAIFAVSVVSYILVKNKPILALEELAKIKED